MKMDSLLTKQPRKIWRSVIFGALLSCLASSAFAWQYTTTGTITTISIHSDHAWETASIHEVVNIQLSSPFSGGCTWLWLQPSSKNVIASLLAAKSSGAPIIVVYETTLTAPWGDTANCALLSVNY